MLERTETKYSVFTELPDGKIEVDDNGPTLNISVDDLADKLLGVISDVVGDDLSKLVGDYNHNVGTCVDQHEYVLEIKKLNAEMGKANEQLTRANEAARKARDVQSKALNEALQTVANLQKTVKQNDADKQKLQNSIKKTESELESYKKKLQEQKKKTSLMEGQKNAALEGGKWFAHKLAGINRELTDLAEHAERVMAVCVEAQAIMKATGRVVETHIEVPSGNLKIAKCPLNIKGALDASHNDTNVRLAACGYDVSLEHNYCYIIDDGLKGQQTVFAGAQPGEFVSFPVPNYTKYKAVKDYLNRQFDAVKTADFDSNNDDTDFYKCVSNWSEMIKGTIEHLAAITKQVKER